MTEESQKETVFDVEKYVSTYKYTIESLKDTLPDIEDIKEEVNRDKNS